MSDWERFGDWIATLAVASFAWVSSALAPGQPVTATGVADAPMTVEPPHSLMMSWAQQGEEPPIEQVGEDTGEDVESLDEAPPPVDEGEAPDDLELLDQGAPPAAQVDQDIELLDQGPPPVAASAAPATSTGTVAPATTYVAPAPVVASGPVLPEGFGTGDVHVSAGRSEFAVGLEACHVGAVTGRAYVGIDCGDGSSFVGHAPSFEEFPFVLDGDFPFDQESVFADRGEDDIEDDVEILVSAARGAPLDDEATAPEVRASGRSSVQFAQRARDRKPRVEAESRGTKRSKESRKADDASVAAVDEDDKQTTAESNKRKKNKESGARGADGDNEKKSKKGKKSKGAKKKKSGEKGKKNRSERR